MTPSSESEEQDQPDPNDLITLDEVAEGLECHRRTVERAVADGKIRVVHLPPKYRLVRTTWKWVRDGLGGQTLTTVEVAVAVVMLAVAYSVVECYCEMSLPHKVAQHCVK